jgi:hypothetical protein
MCSTCPTYHSLIDFNNYSNTSQRVCCKLWNLFYGVVINIPLLESQKYSLIPCPHSIITWSNLVRQKKTPPSGILFIINSMNTKPYLLTVSSNCFALSLLECSLYLCNDSFLKQCSDDKTNDGLHFSIFTRKFIPLNFKHVDSEVLELCDTKHN